MRRRTRKLVWCAMFTALIAVGAFIKIPTPLVPLTLQFFFVALAGLLLGKWMGGACCLVYLAAGLLGIPVFTKGGGLWYVAEPTFGYIVGFVLGAFVAGWIAHGGEGNPGYLRLIAAVLAAMAVVYACGFAYCYAAQRWIHGVAVEWYPLFVSGVLLCLPGDIATGLVGVLIAKRLIPRLRVREGFYAGRERINKAVSDRTAPPSE